VTLAEYRSLLAPAGKAKMRAGALLAEGDGEGRFEAAVLLHDAARAELRAVDALDAPSIETRLAAQVEACGCLLLGLDPVGSIALWRGVEQLALGIAPEAGEAMLARLRPQVEKERRAVRALWKKSPTLVRARTFHPTQTGRPAQARRELDALLARFPGCAPFWVGRAVDRGQAGDAAAAWDAVTRARRLEPETPSIEALELWLLPFAFDAEEARRRLDPRRAGLDRAPPELCLGLALAELVLSDGAGDVRERLTRARDAAARGRARLVLGGRIGPSTQPADEVSAALSFHLAAVEQIAAERLAGHRPGLDVLYRVGLGRAAADAHARGQDDPVDALRGGAPRAFEGTHLFEPLAA